MGLAKLTSAHIGLITFVSVLLIGVTFFFLGPYKTNQNLKSLADRESTADTELGKKAKNEEDRDKARHEVAVVESQFKVYDTELMPQPPIDLMKLTDNAAMTRAMLRLWRQPYELVTAASKYARDQAKVNKVQVQAQFAVAGQTTDPATIPTDIITFPLGTIQVTGSFQNVNDYIRS